VRLSLAASARASSTLRILSRTRWRAAADSCTRRTLPSSKPVRNGVPGPIDAVVALVGLPDHASDPRLAWEEPARSNLPGPVVYWFAIAAVVLAAIVVVGVVTHWLGERRHEPPDKRRRLGTETRARLATTGDLRPLLTRRPVPGRFVLARWAGGACRPRGSTTGIAGLFREPSPSSDRPSQGRRPG